MTAALFDLRPVAEEIVTEDDAPLDNLFQEKCQRLLTRPLYASWRGGHRGRRFLAAANVGVFASPDRQPIVPDAFLSLDVEVPPDWRVKANRSYLIWRFGKPPEVAIEIVSNSGGNETSVKPAIYARMGFRYYAVFDPLGRLGAEPLRVFRLGGEWEEPYPHRQLDGIGLGLSLWEGTFEGLDATFLRWCDEDGAIIPTGEERADQERARSDRLAAQLRAAGIEPDGG